MWKIFIISSGSLCPFQSLLHNLATMNLILSLFEWFECEIPLNRFTSLEGGIIWKGCGTLRSWSLAGGDRSWEVYFKGPLPVCFPFSDSQSNVITSSCCHAFTTVMMYICHNKFFLKLPLCRILSKKQITNVHTDFIYLFQSGILNTCIHWGRAPHDLLKSTSCPVVLFCDGLYFFDVGW